MKKPIYSFDDTTNTGIDKVPLNSPVLIEDSDGAGNPILIYLSDKTGLDSGTTIADLLQLPTQWSSLGGGTPAISDFTAIQDQTSFSANYLQGAVGVYVSGVLLRDEEYTATNGTEIILDNGVDANTWVQIQSYNANLSGDQVSWSNVTASPTTISGYGITDALELGTTSSTALVGDTAVVISDPSAVTGADQVTNIMTLTQEEYDAIGQPDASTIYFITD